MKFFVIALNLFLLTLINCVNGYRVGDRNLLNVSDPEIIRLSKIALLKLNEEKNIFNQEKILVKILKASKQIISGSLTELTLQVLEKNVPKYYVAKIWERPWLNKTEVTFFDYKKTTKKIDNEIINKNEYLLQSFKDFVLKFNKVYFSKEEFKKRFRIFRANMKKINFLNKAEKGTAQYGITEFSDLSVTEFKNYLGLKKKPESKLPTAEIPDVKLPDYFDWRHYNAVTPVKNQGSCGSCWAFSVTGNIEGLWAIKKHELLSLSEQELIDCDKLDNGCNGGYMPETYEAIMKLGGLETETDYPYEAENEKCNLNKTEIKVKINGAVNLTKSELDIAKWLYKNGPVSAGLNANAMQFYLGGISHPPKILCNPEEQDHGILIVGYGIHKSSILKRTIPYWIIKNSWGKHWGEKGYYRLYRGSGVCGINQMVSSALID